MKTRLMGIPWTPPRLASQICTAPFLHMLTLATPPTKSVRGDGASCLSQRFVITGGGDARRQMLQQQVEVLPICTHEGPSFATSLGDSTWLGRGVLSCGAVDAPANLLLLAGEGGISSAGNVAGTTTVSQCAS
jgi:hypothetical protein